MKLRQLKKIIMVILVGLFLSGCGATTKSEPKTVPVNPNKEQSSQEDNKKAPLNEAGEGDIVENADYTGSIIELTKKGLKIDLVEEIDVGGGQVGYGSKGNSLEIELTDKTEYQTYVQKGEKGTLKKAERNAIAEGKPIAVYGSKVGEKLIATKVYIIVPDEDAGAVAQ